jgi:cysteine desulfurase/selenocysteine lyase
MQIDYKQDFPLLNQLGEDGLPLAYLDNAATTQKPQEVIDTVRNFYETFNANPHRGSYAISEQATETFEQVREKFARFIGAKDSSEIVFTSGTTDAINTVALSWGNANIHAGDEILISVLEHHSNLLPWQRLAHEKGATLVYVDPDESGCVNPNDVAAKLTPRTKLLALTQVSNVLGGINPIKEITKIAHKNGTLVLMDAAQSAPHIPVDVTDLDVDFLACSGHKMLAPAGIGMLYGKKAILDGMEPLRLGGGIVEQVTQQTVSFLDTPWKFEAGTQNTEGVVGLGAAIDYLEKLGMDTIQQREKQLTAYALGKLETIPHLHLYHAKEATGIISFNVEDVHPHDTAEVLAAHGVAVRAGHHCAQPLMAYLGVQATCRMSLYFYNTEQDINRLVEALKTVRGVLGYES